MDELTNSTARKVALLASVALIIGSVGPWINTFLGDINGTKGDGAVTLIAAFICGVVVLLTRRPSRWGAGLILGALAAFAAAFIGVGDLIRVESGTQELFGEPVKLASAGWGLWLTAISSVVALLSILVYRREVVADQEQDEGEVLESTR